MRGNEFALTVASYVIGFAVVLAVKEAWSVSGDILPFIGGATLGAAIAAMLYHRRIHESAPNRVKVFAGVALSVTTLVAGTISQALFGWMEFPAANVAIAIVGSLAFPFALFGQMRNAYERQGSHNN